MYQIRNRSIFRAKRDLPNRSGKIVPLLLSLLLSIVAPSSNAVEDSSISISQTIVKKGSKFKGADLILTLNTIKPVHYIVEVEGPRIQYRIWEREQNFGIWTKSKNFTTKKIPSYQFIATDLQRYYIENFSRDFSIDMHGRRIQFVDQDQYDKDDITNVIDTLFKKQKNSMHYVYRFNQPPLIDQTEIKIPILTTSLTGDYNIKIYLLDGAKKIIKKYDQVIEVTKDDFYNTIEDISRDNPLYYIIISIIITFSIAMMSHLVFKRK